MQAAMYTLFELQMCEGTGKDLPPKVGQLCGESEQTLQPAPQ